MGWKMASAGTFSDGGSVQGQCFEMVAVISQPADLGRDGLALGLRQAGRHCLGGVCHCLGVAVVGVGSLATGGRSFRPARCRKAPNFGDPALSLPMEGGCRQPPPPPRPTCHNSSHCTRVPVTGAGTQQQTQALRCFCVVHLSTATRPAPHPTPTQGLKAGALLPSPSHLRRHFQPFPKQVGCNDPFGVLDNHPHPCVTTRGCNRCTLCMEITNQ